MASRAVAPSVPMPVKQALVNPRLHFAFRPGRFACRVTRLVLAIRIDARYKRNPFPVGRPQFVVSATGKGSELIRVASIECDPVNLLLTVARRKERESLSIG